MLLVARVGLFISAVLELYLAHLARHFSLKHGEAVHHVFKIVLDDGLSLLDLFNLQLSYYLSNAARLLRLLLHSLEEGRVGSTWHHVQDHELGGVCTSLNPHPVNFKSLLFFIVRFNLDIAKSDWICLSLSISHILRPFILLVSPEHRVRRLFGAVADQCGHLARQFELLLCFVRIIQLHQRYWSLF